FSATSNLWNSIARPVNSRQAATRAPIGPIGVSDEVSSSLSMLRRARLSTMTTSCPLAERCSDVGQPQKPSPPRIKTFKVPPNALLLYHNPSIIQSQLTLCGKQP